MASMCGCRTADVSRSRKFSNTARKLRAFASVSARGSRRSVMSLAAATPAGASRGRAFMGLYFLTRVLQIGQVEAQTIAMERRHGVEQRRHSDQEVAKSIRTYAFESTACERLLSNEEAVALGQ